jgi:RimJ/RimL family protein N-acetyltransferase
MHPTETSPIVDGRHYHVEETLRDGTPVTIRAARHDDRERIVRAFRLLERESIYTRFFTYKETLTPAELAQLDKLDFVRDVMLLATQRTGGDETVIGGASYVALDARRAEVAFTVEEDFRGRGLASRLLSHLIAIARQCGIDRFEADVLPGNGPMLAVFSRSGLAIHRRLEGGVVHVELVIGEQA